MSENTGLAREVPSKDDQPPVQGEVIVWPKGTAPAGPVFQKSSEWKRIGAYSVLAVADGCAFLAAFAIASLLRLGGIGWGPEAELIAVALPLLLWSVLLSKGYSVQALERPAYSTRVTIKALLFVLAMMVGMMFFLKNGELYSRLVIGLTATFAIILTGICRVLLGKWMLRRANGHFTNDLVIVDGPDFVPADGVRVLDASAAQIQPDRTDPAMLDRLARLIRHSDRILVACPAGRREAWAATLKSSRTNVEVLVPELGALRPLALRTSGNVPAVTVTAAPLSFGNRVLKRSFDLVVTIPALILLAPVLAACALAIKLDSPGPILFRQPRVGRSNKMFEIYKFRSMRVDQLDRDGHRSTGRDDDRITRLGRFLRRTSLDELPQLFNVIRGDMSLVGPRPHAVGSRAEEALFWEIDEGYWDRHSVKPGLTGEAQVRGFRGATEKREDLVDRLQADIEYVNNWSLGRDVRILLQTVRVLVHSKAF